MFHSKLRHAPKNSIIDISPIQPSKVSFKSSSYNQNRAHSQSRISSDLSHYQLCRSFSNDSLDKDFIQNTKQTFDKLFHQTNFNELLEQIQCTLQPLANQLRHRIQQKNCPSKQDRLICMKSCAKFINETLLSDQWDLDDHFPEFYQLQNVLNQFLSKERTTTSTQTSEPVELDMKQLQIDDNVERVSSSQKVKKLPKLSFVPVDELTRQKTYHRSVSRAFKKLNADLQRMTQETPFQSHLSKYHKHNH